MNAKLNTELINQYCTENGLSKKAFCKKCGVSPATLTKIYKENNAGLKTLYKIAYAMDIRILELIVEN